MSQDQTTGWDGRPPEPYTGAGWPHWLDAGATTGGHRVRFVALWSGWRWVTAEGDAVKPAEAAAYDWRYVRPIVDPVGDE